jgi:acyl carrier protein
VPTPKPQNRPGLSNHDIVSIVEAQIHSFLGVTDVSEELPLLEAGLDSLSSVQLTNQLQGALNLSLPRTLVFDYPTKARIASHLSQQISPLDS